ncbi:MAG: SPOR domain-containing protein [Desulfobacterales bacterium]
MKHQFPTVGFWLAAGLLTIMSVSGMHPVGLADIATVPPPTHATGAARLMSPTGFSDRPMIISKKISPSPSPPAVAGSGVVSKKIEPPRAVLMGASASPAAIASPSDTAPVPTEFERTAASDERPLTAVFLDFFDRWRDPGLGRTLDHDAGGAESDFLASVKGDDAALSSDRPLQVAPFVNALLTGNEFGGLPAAVLSAHQTSGAAAVSATPPRPEPAPPAPLLPGANGIPDTPRLLPYSLQLSSCRSLTNARNAAADFRKKGLDPYLVNVYLKSHSGSWWRVMSGQYPSVEAAQRDREALQLTQAIVKRTRFANLIGEYQNKDALLEEKKRLETSGISTYTVEDAAAGFRLYVGAFTRKHQAEKQAIDLRTNGLMCRVVLR